MQRFGSFAVSFLLAAGYACGQQSSPTSVPAQAGTQQKRVTVYSVGPGVAAPQLLPLDLPPLSPEKCNSKQDGKVVLSILVDETGSARNIMFQHPLGTDLDKIALKIAALDRFTPGTHDGTPVVVAGSLEAKIQSCLVESLDSDGKKLSLLKLRSVPAQQLGGLPAPPDGAILTGATGEADPTSGAMNPKIAGTDAKLVVRVEGDVKAPVPLLQPAAPYSDAAREKKIEGVSLIGLIVDPQGMPQNIHVVRPLGYGLDEKAVETVRRYRFKPAMRNGEPIPLYVNVEMNFRLK